LACHWLAIGLPLACHWLAIGLPLACVRAPEVRVGTGAEHAKTWSDSAKTATKFSDLNPKWHDPMNTKSKEHCKFDFVRFL
jgi:hypothetical protein